MFRLERILMRSRNVPWDSRFRKGVQIVRHVVSTRALPHALQSVNYLFWKVCIQRFLVDKTPITPTVSMLCLGVGIGLCHRERSKDCMPVSLDQGLRAQLSTTRSSFQDFQRHETGSLPTLRRVPRRRCVGSYCKVRKPVIDGV